MTTNANDTTKEQALGAIYRKYLTVVEGMSRDDAVQFTRDNPCQYTAEELNQAISKKHKLNFSFSAKPESKQEKTLQDYLNEQQIAEAQRLVASGIRGSTLKMYCRDLFKVRDKAILQAIVALLDVKVTRTGARGDSLDDKFNAFCAEKVRTVDEMKAFINEIGSKNFIRFTPHLIARGEMFNKVHAMYK
jgi:hypothetical protein